MPTLGAAAVSSLELRWVDLATLTEQVATVSINVNVVPGDVAAGRLPAVQLADRADLAGAPELASEAQPLRSFADNIQRGDARAAAKQLRMDLHHKTQRRGQ